MARHLPLPDGWSRNGLDMFHVATRMAGFDAGELMKEIYRRSPRAVKINEPMVLNAMQRISDRYKATGSQAATNPEGTDEKR
jgi:hypothetical protein